MPALRLGMPPIALLRAASIGTLSFDASQGPLAPALAAGVLMQRGGGGGRDPLAGAVERLGQPGEFHAKLKPLAGRWDLAVRRWKDADAPPEEAKGTSERTWILAGRYLREDLQSTLGSGAFGGMGLLGYDNVLQKFTSMWVDSSTTTMMTASGKCSADGKVLTLTGQYSDPVSGKAEAYRSIIQIEGENEHKLELLVPGSGGKEFRMLEVTYRRQGVPVQAAALKGDVVLTRSGGVLGQMQTVTITPRGLIRVEQRGSQGSKTDSLAAEKLAELAALLKDWEHQVIGKPKNPKIAADGISYTLSYRSRTLAWSTATGDEVSPAVAKVVEWIEAAAAILSGK